MAVDNLVEDLIRMRGSFKDRYINLSKFKGKEYEGRAKAAKRAYLDLSNLLRNNGLIDKAHTDEN